MCDRYETEVRKCVYKYVYGSVPHSLFAKVIKKTLIIVIFSIQRMDTHYVLLMVHKIMFKWRIKSYVYSKIKYVNNGCW